MLPVQVTKAVEPNVLDPALAESTVTKQRHRARDVVRIDVREDEQLQFQVRIVREALDRGLLGSPSTAVDQDVTRRIRAVLDPERIALVGGKHGDS